MSKAKSNSYYMNIKNVSLLMCYIWSRIDSAHTPHLVVYVHVRLCLQNRSLQSDARATRALRDELDCARERATRTEQLQTELQSCKHRLRSLELTRTQLKVTNACKLQRSQGENLLTSGKKNKLQSCVNIKCI